MLTTVGGSAGPGMAQATVVTPFSTEWLATSVPGAPCSARPVDQPRGFDEVLRGEAASVHTGAAQDAGLGHGDRLAEPGRPRFRGEGGGSADQDNKVEVLSGYLVLVPPGVNHPPC